MMQKASISILPTFKVAGENSRSSEVNSLYWWIDGCFQRSSHSQNSLNALSSNRIVHDAQILSRILHFSLSYDQSSCYLLDAVVQCDWLFSGRTIDEFVPPAKISTD